jgi:hypothetical protein
MRSTLLVTQRCTSEVMCAMRDCHVMPQLTFLEMRLTWEYAGVCQSSVGELDKHAVGILMQQVGHGRLAMMGSQACTVAGLQMSARGALAAVARR